MPLSTRDDVDVDLIVEWLSELTVDQYFQFAIFSVIAYDIVITMDKEVRYFWPSPTNSVNLVYFANRYIGLLGAVVPLLRNSAKATLFMCNFGAWIRNISYWCTIILIDYILMIRVLALYSRRRDLSIFLSIFLAIEAASRLAVSIYNTVVAQIASFDLGAGVLVCGSREFVDLAWKLSYIEWVIPLIFGVVLLSLALYKAAKYWKESEGVGGYALVQILIRDQLVYFALTISFCILNIIMVQLAIDLNDFLAGLLELLGCPSFLSLLGSRLLINLKEAGEEGRNEGTNYSRKSLSNMEFS